MILKNISSDARLGWRHPSIFVTLITLCVSVVLMAMYVRGPLLGNFHQHFLPAEKFGVPDDLRARGITELFHGSKESGWDGQFYYYIANDPFGLKDTPEHIDSDAYRYQRIGLPLIAKTISLLTLQSWVTPLTYYLTSLSLVLIAVVLAASFFGKRGVSPFSALFWSLGLGTQVTIINGLPDAAADALVIIALVSLVDGRRWLYAIAIMFAALARETYVLVPLMIVLVYYLLSFRENSWRLLELGRLISIGRSLWVHALPLVVFMLWHIFIRVRFGVAPSEQAHDILGVPLASIFNHLLGGLSGNHPFVGTGRAAYEQGIGILLFLGLLALSASALMPYLRGVVSRQTSISVNAPDGAILGTASAFFTIALLYLCFGRTVMMYHTGYIKAASIFLFVIPFFAAMSGRQLKKVEAVSLLIFTVFFSTLLWGRVSAPADYRNYTTPLEIRFAEKEPSCLSSYRAHIQPVSIVDIFPQDTFRRILMKRAIVIRAQVSNTSNEVFSPYPGKGAVNVSYHWLSDEGGKIAKDGIRTSLPGPLNPGESIEIPIVVEFPDQAGAYTLRLTPVQEGCAWFYLVEPASAFDIRYTVK